MVSAEVRELYDRMAPQYAEGRPHYHALIKHLASLCQRTECAWDCATGSGQAAVSLADHFDRVIATDASPGQIKQARETPHPNIEFRVADTEDSGIDGDSVDLVTVAQAYHWFDPDAFLAEVRRVAREGAILSIWCYQTPTVDPAIDPVIHALYTDHRLDGLWPDRKPQVDGGYPDLTMPFDRIELPDFVAEEAQTLQQFGSYLDTWQAVEKSKSHPAAAAFVAEQLAQLAVAWGPAGRARLVRWPLSVWAWTLGD